MLLLGFRGVYKKKQYPKNYEWKRSTQKVFGKVHLMF